MYETCTIQIGKTKRMSLYAQFTGRGNAETRERGNKRQKGRQTKVREEKARERMEVVGGREGENLESEDDQTEMKSRLQAQYTGGGMGGDGGRWGEMGGDGGRWGEMGGDGGRWGDGDRAGDGG